MNFCRSLLAIAIFYPSIHCFSQTKATARTSTIPFYNVTITGSNIRKVNVEAILPLETDTIYMSQNEFSPLKNGYATFVNDLKAFDNDGSTLKLTSVGKGLWKVNAAKGSVVKLNYNVSMEHDKIQWTVSGAFARSYSADDILFFTGRTIFIAPKGSATSKIRILYSLPKDWGVATPYTEFGTTPNDFEALSLSDLWHNGNMIGKFVTQEIKVNKLRVVVVGMPGMKASVTLIANTLTEIINKYTSGMGGSPEGKLVIMGSVRSFGFGGETFARSISVMFFQAPDESNKEQWGYLMAHEVFHLWNGQAISSVNQSRVEWFVEGFTEYMSKLTSYQTGFISRSEFLRQMEYSFATYQNLAGKISLVEAGSNKGLNYNFIYNGGTAIAIALDNEMRRATKNRKGIVDFMNAMYRKFGKTNLAYSYDDLVKTSSEVALVNMSDFFASYVSGTKIMPPFDMKEFSKSISPE